MDVPLQVSFRNLEHSDAVEARVREKAEKLEQYYGRITSCKVMIEAPERHHRKGKLYHVRLEINVPGDTVIVSRHPSEKQAHEDIYVAIRDAFKAARRQLEDHSRKQRGKVKTHDAPPHGKVVRLFSEEGYGFIEMPDGQEIYFHRNSVVNNGFAKLEQGSPVRLVVADGESEKGPQASTVHVIGKHHIVE